LERQHIAAALVFELSKVETQAIRSRVVAHLLNIDDRLAMNVAEGLRLDSLPAPATRVVPARDDLSESPSLSIMRSAAQTFAGRRLGVLVTDGVDGSFLRQLENEFNDIGATVELVAPAIGGIKSEDGSWIEARKSLATAPSVLFDAVAIVVAPQASKEVAKSPVAFAFVADAYAHCKFIAYTADARPLLERALVTRARRAGRESRFDDVTRLGRRRPVARSDGCGAQQRGGGAHAIRGAGGARRSGRCRRLRVSGAGRP